MAYRGIKLEWSSGMQVVKNPIMDATIIEFWRSQNRAQTNSLLIHHFFFFIFCTGVHQAFVFFGQVLNHILRGVTIVF